MSLQIAMGIFLLAGGAGGSGAGSGRELSLTGRLIDFAFEAPDCGTMQFFSLAVYDRVEGGGLPERVYVAHPCIELPRKQYSATAGSLERFVIGQRHRLRMVRADPGKLGALVRADIDPKDQPIYLARRVDWAVEKVRDPRSVGDLCLAEPDRFPERLREAVRAVGQSVGASAEFWAQIEPDRRTGELVFHLWHQAAFLPANRGMLGNPGGKCRDVHYSREHKKVTRTLFWQ